MNSPKLFLGYNLFSYFCGNEKAATMKEKECDTPILHPLKTDLSAPERLNNPFCYKPHPLCLAAVADVMPLIEALPLPPDEGKMFGVLIVQPTSPIPHQPSSIPHPPSTVLHPPSPLAYLAAYSGQIGGRADWPGFVPAIVDYLQPDGYFKTHEAEISALNHQIETLEQNPERTETLERLKETKREAQENVTEFRKKVMEAKTRRREMRETQPLSDEQEAALVRESQFMKAELHRMRQHYKATIEQLEAQAEIWEKPIRDMKQARHERSDALQHWLFERFDLLNIHGQRRMLTDIFAQTSQRVPPSGAGECCAPRLLQYAFAHGLRPVAIAEFWHGPSPKVEIRHDGHFYPACRGKCLPILTWMLDLPYMPSVGTEGKTEGAELPIVYEDDDIVVVDKPAGLLSTPGISEHYSVYTIMRQRYPDADSPLSVHRLDQPTSGLLIVAKTKEVHLMLQKQFMNHEVKKRYVALLEKPISQQPSAKGTIDLPLLVDPLNRPYQIVDRENGKVAITHYECLGQRRIALYPQTGRTHQLRVHCAHAEGLGNPILGDDLYGRTAADRLYLHAEAIDFVHPTTGQHMHLEAKAPF